MTELKTLDEIGNDCDWIECDWEIHKKELKADVIKEVKIWEEQKRKNPNFKCFVVYNKFEKVFLTQEVINYIKWKFNLTSEDLK
jgi:hypothetical protein